ncbi:hypothetical protein GCM10022222_15130 [Amycolatopsis ultiminotia]|uniref:Uncharacterized protein n=1 Tax=Amycolatopsis ultiminotia TaxID=543629 RepID=A0ABP6VFL7_9PSEU
MHAEPIAELVLGKLGVAAAELPSLPLGCILAAQNELVAELRRGAHPECGRVPLPFVPLAGGELLPCPAVAAVADGVGADVAFLTGSNRDECTLYELTAEMRAGADLPTTSWDADPALQRRIRAVYDRDREPGAVIGTSIAIDTDRIFGDPDAADRRGAPVRRWLHPGVPVRLALRLLRRTRRRQSPYGRPLRARRFHSVADQPAAG